MSEKVNVDGLIRSPEDAVISVMDHGFLFGDSIYETLRTYGGRFFRWDAHLERLRTSGDALGLDVPLDSAALRQRVDETVAAAAQPDAAVRVVVTRGVGPMELDPARCLRPSVLVYVRQRPRFEDGSYGRGQTLKIVRRKRNPRRSLDPNVKSGNYLNNVLALVEARGEGAFEGVMLNAEGQVAECTTSNVFAVREGAVWTAPVSAGLLSGITRREVLRLCSQLGVSVREKTFGPDALRSADEVFITSSIKQVMPIRSVDGRPVGPGPDGGPGPVTKRLLAAYRAAVAEETGVVPDDDP